MPKTNQTKKFKRQPGDLHRWRPASLFSLAVIIMLVYQCRRLISGCLLIRRLLILIVIFVLLLLIMYLRIVLLLLLLIIILLLLRLLVLLLIIIIIIIINVFLITLFCFLSTYSDESLRTLRA